jgi:hypothetical protein
MQHVKMMPWPRILALDPPLSEDSHERMVHRSRCTVPWPIIGGRSFSSHAARIKEGLNCANRMHVQPRWHMRKKLDHYCLLKLNPEMVRKLLTILVMRVKECNKGFTVSKPYMLKLWSNIF